MEQKHIGQKAISPTGNITVKFADRCHEYKAAGIPIKPTTITTYRLIFGPLPATLHLVDVGGSCEFLYLN